MNHSTGNPLPDLPPLPDMPPASFVDETSAFGPERVQTLLISAFGQMAGGLVLTALTSFAVWRLGLSRMLLESPFVTIFLLVAQIGVALVFGARMARSSASSLRMMFGLYAILTGMTFSTLAEVYTQTTLFLAFGISALYFACLVMSGLLARRSLNRMGTLCLCGLLVLLISQAVFMLLGIPLNVRLYCILGLILFTGITIWDVSRMKTLLLSEDRQTIPQENWAVYFALELYLDFVNVFLYILRLFSAGAGSSSRN